MGDGVSWSLPSTVTARKRGAHASGAREFKRKYKIRIGVAVMAPAAGIEAGMLGPPGQHTDVAPPPSREADARYAGASQRCQARQF